MTGSVVELAIGLRQALTEFFGSLGDHDTEDQSRQARHGAGARGPVVAGPPRTADRARHRPSRAALPSPGRDPVPGSWAGRAEWHLSIADVLMVDGTRVDVLAPTLPQKFVLELRLRAAGIAPGVEVRGGVLLTVTVPAEAARAKLVFAVRGLSLVPPSDPLLVVLLPAGPAYAPARGGPRATKRVLACAGTAGSRTPHYLPRSVRASRRTERRPPDRPSPGRSRPVARTAPRPDFGRPRRRVARTCAGRCPCGPTYAVSPRYPELRGHRRKERARIRSEKGIHWGGRPLAVAA